MLALKAYAAWKTFPPAFAQPEWPARFWGTCASSVDEARLGRKSSAALSALLPRPRSEGGDKGTAGNCGSYHLQFHGPVEALQAAD